MRRDPPPPVYDGGGRRDELDRRDLKGLTEGDGCKLHEPHIFLFVHDRRRLSGKIDPGLSQKSELLEIMIERIHSQPRPDIDKHRIAGIHRALKKCLAAMSADLMAADLPVFDDPEARAGEPVIQMDHSRLQSRRGSDDLKCGTGLVGIVDAAVPPHFISRVLKLAPSELAAVQI